MLFRRQEMDKQSATQSSNKRISEFDNFQLRESIETFRTQFNLLIQLLTVLVIANVTILGFAISNKIAGIIFIAAVIPLIMILIILGSEKYMLPIIYTAISLEEKNGERNTDYLASTFVAAIISVEFNKELREISLIENSDDRLNTLKKQKMKIINKRKLQLGLLFITILEIIVGILSYFYFGWRIF